MLTAMRSRPRSAPRSRIAPRSRTRRLLPWLAVCIVAAVTAVLFTFRVSVSPPGLHPREVVFAVAETQVFVDNSPSMLLSYGQNVFQEKEYEVYNPALAGTLAKYLQSQGPLQAMAAAAGIPHEEVSASGPFTVQPDATNFAPTGPQIDTAPAANKHYRLLVDFDDVRPMLSLYGQAPTERAAVAIVNSARAQLIGYVVRQQRRSHLSPAQRPIIRPLGGTVGGVVDSGARLQLLGVVFGLVFVLGGGLVVFLQRRARMPRRPAWARRPTATEPLDDDVDLWPHTRRFLPWCMAGFLGMLFLVPIDAIRAPLNSLPIAPTLDRIFLCIIVIGCLIALRSSRDRARPRIRLTRVHLMMFLFAGICFAGVALNGVDLAVNQEVMPVVKKLVLLLTFVTFFVVAAAVIRPGEVRPLMKLLVGLGVVCAIGTIIERQTRFNIFYDVWNGVLPVTKPPEMDVLDDIGRLGVVGPTSEPLELATLLSLVLPFAMIFALESKVRRQRLLYLAAGAIILAGAIATSRKTAVVAPLVGLGVLIAYRPRVILRALLIAMVPLFIVIHIALPGQLGSTLSELQPSRATAVNTDKVRVQRYDAVRPDIMSHLLLGRGFESYDPLKYRYLDNEYLGLLIGTGVIGTVAFLAILGSLFTLGHPLIRGPDEYRSSPALALQVALVMILVTSALFDALSFDHVSYMLFYLGALLLAMHKPSRAALRATGLDLVPALDHGPAPGRSRSRSGRERQVEQPLMA
jgi:hypothetical protein